MNAKAWQDLMLQTVQRIDATQQDHTKAIAGVSAKCDDMSNRLGNLEKNTHSVPCAHVQTLREKISTSSRLIKWFVALIAVLITSFVGYVITNS